MRAQTPSGHLLRSTIGPFEDASHLDTPDRPGGHIPGCDSGQFTCARSTSTTRRTAGAGLSRRHASAIGSTGLFRSGTYRTPVTVMSVVDATTTATPTPAPTR